MFRITRHILSIVCVLTFFSTQAANPTEFDVSGIAYRVIGANRVEVVARGSVNYQGLVSIAIPATVSYDGEHYNIYSIGDRAFSGCESLQRVVLPATITSLGHATFEGCKSLKTINIPKGVTSISDRCFNGCSALDAIKLPSSLTTLGSRAFADCVSLKEISLNAGFIDYYAFDGCRALESVNLGQRLRDLGKCCFRNCTKLKEIEIPDDVVEIDDSTFYGCQALRKVSIGAGVDLISLTAFINCPSLESYKVSDYNYYYSSVDGMLCDSTANTLIAFPSGKAVEYNLSCSTIRRIGKWAFRDNAKLEILNMRGVILDVEEEAFLNCQSLKTLELPLSTKRIYDRAFAQCRNLKFVRMRTSINYLGHNLFNGCNALEQLHCRQRHPDIVQIESDAFSGVPATCPLYVPLRYGDAYRSIAKWNDAFSSIVEEDVIIPGDVNDDELCNVSDISTLYAYIIDPNSNIYIDTEAADMNGDGKINVSDISMIYEIIIK